MTVAELIAQLQQFDEDAKVHFAYNAGDYWRTTVAPEASSVEEGYVKHSNYHNKPVLDENEDGLAVVVIA